MELLKILESIADRCEGFMKIPPEPFIHNRNYELYKFIKTELQNNITDHFKNIAEAKTLLDLIFNEVPDKENIYGTIYSKILIDIPDYLIFQFFCNRYYDRNVKGMNYNLLAKVVFSFDIIRLICYTEHSEQIPEPDYQKELIEISESENKFWKGLPMDTVVTHFKIMTQKKSKNGNVFLTSEQLISFLKKGFLNDTIQPKQKINCSYSEKGFIIKRFYEFYDIAVSQYGYPAKKENFINLFVDCFDNWNKKSVTSFFKPAKTKGKW